MSILRPLAKIPLVLAALTLLGQAGPSAAQITVFAAASLKSALDPVIADWSRATGHPAVASYAGSSVLARQIGAGAPADLFISANPLWMDDVQARGLIDPETRRDLLGNRLVLIAHGDTAGRVDLSDPDALPRALGTDRLAMALVDAVPAGIYGREALTSLGIWDRISGSVAQTDNVRAALALVALGETPFGIVYVTDARAEPRVTVVADFPDTSHGPIIYPAAVVSGANPKARDLLDHLSTPDVQAYFAAQGFVAAE